MSEAHKHFFSLCCLMLSICEINCILPVNYKHDACVHNLLLHMGSTGGFTGNALLAR